MTNDIRVKFNLVPNELITNSIESCLPTRAEELSTGYDVRNAGPPIYVNPFERIKIPLGFRAYIPSGYWFFVTPRSSSFSKKNLHALYGVVDESYEGQWMFFARYIPDYDTSCSNGFNMLKPILIDHGERVAQIILLPRYDMSIESITNEEFEQLTKNRGALRGAGGMGSTGNK